MDENEPANKPDLIQVTTPSSEYTIVAGSRTEIEVLLSNSGSGDFFIVNLLGVPPGWVESSGPSAVWVPAGDQERVTLTVRPPAAAEGVAGSYPARLYVFPQSAPDHGKEIPIHLAVVPPDKVKKAFALRVESKEISAAPGTTLKIPVVLGSSSQKTEYLELSVQGVPANWVSLPAPVVSLLAGEEKSVDIYIQLPASPEIRPGYYPLKISVASQNDPAIKEEVEIRLGIIAFESQGPVGVMLATVQFSAAPGGSVTVPITLLNRGLAAATFRLGVEGIPISWVSTSTPLTPLQPGERKEVSLVVRPPFSSSSPAGRNKFRIVVMNQESTDQVVKVECVLTVAAYTKFSADLEPEEVDAGKPVSVTVKNEGNTRQVFHLSCTSTGNKLVFEFLEPEEVLQPDGQPGTPAPPRPPGPNAGPDAHAGDPTALQIAPGETRSFLFTAKPRQRPWLGGMDIYPYQAIVEADHKQSPPLAGEVKGRGMIPVWVLAIAVILCMWVGFSAMFSLFGDRNQANYATQTAAAATSLAIGPTQTLLAGTAISAGATQTVIANQTAAALAGQQDTDGDGLTNQREAEVGTDPANADSDADGLMDGEEALQVRTNPLVPDTDGDGLRDGDEVRLRTDPLNVDSDGDNSRDGDEVRIGTNPLNRDSDNDGLQDGSEVGPCPNPLNPDSDQDGLVDGRDQNPCNSSNPALTPTATLVPPPSATLPPVINPTQTPSLAPVPPTSPQLPRFPGNLLFETNRDGNPELYTTDNSGQMRRLTNNPVADSQGSWDPNLRRIAYTTNRDGQNEIYLMNADGSNAVNLTNNPADDQNPTWSIDGEWIAFASNRDGNYEIYIIRVSNFETRNITNSPGNDTQPSWVRSRTGDAGGEYILFTSDRDGNREVYRIRVDGSEALNLTSNPANDEMPKGSPDGGQVAFTTNRDGNQEIYLMSLDGTGLSNVTSNPANDFGPAWARDQTWIAFSTDRVGNGEVYIMKPGLPDLVNITNNPAQDQVSDWK